MNLHESFNEFYERNKKLDAEIEARIKEVEMINQFVNKLLPPFHKEEITIDNPLMANDVIAKGGF